MESIDQLGINTVRILAADAVQKANSGHPGTPMGLAPMGHVLWTKIMNYNPKDPEWPNRDRFILSCGHACMLQYSYLYLTGYDISMDDIKNFRQLHSKTAGHPEYGLLDGIEVTTGPLGQGFANGVGMGIAQQYIAARYNKPGFKLFDYSVAMGILWKEWLQKRLRLQGILNWGTSFIYTMITRLPLKEKLHWHLMKM
jgi:transketolase